MSSHTPLLFIDTNIFLDFYRATGSADFKLLGRLKTILASIITSGQIEMEFQKNRQKLMHTSFQKLVLQGRPEVPGLFVHSKEGDMLTGALRQVDESLKELKKSLSAVLRKAELLRVLGRRLTERLVRAGWIIPVSSTPDAIFFDRHEVHLALKRLARDGWMLNGHTRNASVPPRPKVQRLSLEEALAGVELESFFYE